MIHLISNAFQNITRNHFLAPVIVFIVIAFITSCAVQRDSRLAVNNDIKRVSVNGNQFFKGESPYYFVGANYWYGSILGSKKLGDRERLILELDQMKSSGIDNLRILIGADGSGEFAQVEPALQPSPGTYNDDLLEGLDFLLMQMRKRDMYGVLYFTNNWIWSGGMSTYLKWYGYGEVPNPFLEQYSWDDYMKYTEQFHSCEPCLTAYHNHVKFIMTRTNRFTKIKYAEDHTIMSWQLSNEPRVFSSDNKTAFENWVNTTVNIIDSIDSQHLISTGAEGKVGFLYDLSYYEKVHAHEKIDYLTMHMWPKNWQWYNPDDEPASLITSIENAKAYMRDHLQIAEKIRKPIVMSEFGFPRNKESLSLESSVEHRDVFYQSIVDMIVESKKTDGALAGLNFWGYAGIGKSNGNTDGVWRNGDDFLADPPQEPQGLNSVFSSDTTTMHLVMDGNKRLNSIK